MQSTNWKFAINVPLKLYEKFPFGHTVGHFQYGQIGNSCNDQTHHAMVQ